ncbi:multidrug effflux MFS transporter [Pseudooceanicola sp.]|uniref:multidrug effflux MFS transporter n=1 Tax=Pseudooceanicola sp. TaxID=1914328 RepID=UPI002637B636|nr:multidrug effflux MFS transporter [Pseudooceanicola sp.]MDF1853902.1 multidrug effflux MFS transporter [Pseudooceanicola sp.]
MALRAATTPPHIATLVLLTGSSVLTLNMFLPSLAHMAQDFGVDYGVMSLAIGGYLAMTAVTQIVIGPISDRYGRRPVVLVGMAVFFMASLLCTLTEDFHWFLFGRMMQSSAATGMALSRAAIRDQYDERESAAKLAVISTLMAVAPMMGPMLGGFLDSVFGWRANFAVYSASGAILFVLCWLDAGETHHNRSSSFGAQFREYPELITSRRFWGYSFCAALSVSTFHIFVTAAPLVAPAQFGMGTAELGMWMGSITLGFMIGTAITSRMSRSYPLTTMIIAGRVLAIVGIGVPGLILAAGYVSEPLFFGAMILSGIGNGLTSPNANAGSISVRPHLAGSASGLSSALIVATGAVVTTLTGSLVTKDNGLILVPVMMVIASVLGLLAALYVRRINRIEAQIGAQQAAAE